MAAEHKPGDGYTIARLRRGVPGAHIAVASVVAVLPFAAPASAVDSSAAIAACTSHDSIAANDRIDACTTIIKSGTLTRSRLALAFGYRGMGYKMNRDFARAILDFTQAIELKPANRAAYLARASAYLQQGQVPEAIADLSAIIRREPNFATAFYLRGAAEARIGRVRQSKADVARALAIDPNVQDQFK